VTIVNRDAQACMQVWTVQVWVDEQGDLVAVKLSRGSP